MDLIKEGATCLAFAALLAYVTAPGYWGHWYAFTGWTMDWLFLFYFVRRSEQPREKRRKLWQPIILFLCAQGVMSYLSYTHLPA
jgi:hypothetical protein